MFLRQTRLFIPTCCSHGLEWPTKDFKTRHFHLHFCFQEIYCRHFYFRCLQLFYNIILLTTCTMCLIFKSSLWSVYLNSLIFLTVFHSPSTMVLFHHMLPLLFCLPLECGCVCVLLCFLYLCPCLTLHFIPVCPSLQDDVLLLLGCK